MCFDYLFSFSDFPKIFKGFNLKICKIKNVKRTLKLLK